MTPIEVVADLTETPFNDTNYDAEIHADRRSAVVVGIGLMPEGTSDGRPSAMLTIRLPDGRLVVAETTWRLLHVAVRALATSPLGEAGLAHE